MKHIQSFNGAVTSLLSRLGYDSKAVLAACNAWRGGVKAGEEKATGETKLVGAITSKGQDNRTLTVRDSVKTVAKKLSYSAPGALIALSDALTALTDRHGVRLELAEFPPEIAEWLDRDSFRPVQGPAEKPAEDVAA